MDNKLYNLKRSRPIWYKSATSDYDVDVDSWKISGYLASFNNKDDDGDVIMPSAFNKSLADHGVNSTSPRKIILLYNHDLGKPMGRFTKLEADSKGLYYEAEVDPIDRNNDILIQMKSGTINQHSIGFRYVWDKTIYDDKSETFYLNEVRLYEGSVVSIGANENTPFEGFKNLNYSEQQEMLLKSFEEILKDSQVKDSIAIRQIVNKMIALEQSLKPSEVKQILREEIKPQGIDWSKVAELIKV